MLKVLSCAETSVTKVVNADSVMTVTSHMPQVVQLVNQLVIVHHVNHELVAVVAAALLAYQAYVTTSVMMVHVNLVMNVDSNMVMLIPVTSPFVAPPAKPLLVSVTNSKNQALATTRANVVSATKLPRHKTALTNMDIMVEELEGS